MRLDLESMRNNTRADVLNNWTEGANLFQGFTDTEAAVREKLIQDLAGALTHTVEILDVLATDSVPTTKVRKLAQDKLREVFGHDIDFTDMNPKSKSYLARLVRGEGDDDAE
jgi:hypothetical protein